jgi:hypothetical protein
MVMFSLFNSQSLTSNITYQAIIAKDSPVFDIAGRGTVTQLIKAVEKGTASLTDRDEYGCSLLQVRSFPGWP